MESAIPAISKGEGDRSFYHGASAPGADLTVISQEEMI